MIWIIWIVFILADAWFNDYRIERKWKINHWVNVAYRSVIGFAFLFFIPTILQTLIFVLGGFFSFWLLFNLFLNYLRGLPLDYLGKDSLLDRFEAGAPTFIMWTKLVCSAAFIYAYYHTELL